MNLRDELRKAIQEYADAVAADALASEGHAEWHEEAEEILCAKARVFVLLEQIPAALDASFGGQAPGHTILHLPRTTPCD